MEFEVFPVLSSPAVRERLAPRLGPPA